MSRKSVFCFFKESYTSFSTHLMLQNLLLILIHSCIKADLTWHNEPSLLLSYRTVTSGNTLGYSEGYAQDRMTSTWARTQQRVHHLCVFPGLLRMWWSHIPLPSPCSNYPVSVWPGTEVWRLVGCLLSLNAPRSPWARREPAGLSSPAHPGRGTCCSAARAQRAELLPTPGKTCWQQQARH